MTPAEINQLAQEIIRNEVFTTDHIRSGSLNLVPSIFMPVALGCFNDMTPEERADIDMLYAYYKDAGPLCVNGYPIFFSVRAVNKKDARLVREKVALIEKAMKILAPEPPPVEEPEEEEIISSTEVE